MIIVYILILLWIGYVYYKMSNNQSSTPYIEIEKTMCFGTCPVYKAKIYNNGRVEYEGEQFVDVIGKRELLLSESDMEDIKEMVKYSNFSNLNDEYDAFITDVPTTYITVNGKQIKSRWNIPDRLQMLIELVHKKIMNKLN